MQQLFEKPRAPVVFGNPWVFTAKWVVFRSFTLGQTNIDVETMAKWINYLLKIVISHIYILLYVSYPGKRPQTVCSWDSKGKGRKNLKSSVAAS
jgi:hypothetical protein